MIYTFYSFKGGVGRSMALANLAESFHERGLRVVMIDWDLEAPGLEAFFCPSIGDQNGLAAARAHPGLIDMLVAYKEAFPRFAAKRAAAPAGPPTAESEQYARDLERASALKREILRSANVPEFLLDTEEREVPATFPDFLDNLYRPEASARVRSDLPETLATSPFHQYLQCIHEPDSRENGLYLLSAGARGEDRFARYATTVQEFDWSEFYAACEGRQYFTWFRQQLRAIADVILIDSRTGVTEMGGVCTRHLPDVVISFCAPNFQNVDGTVRVISGLNKPEVLAARGDERHIEVMVIPTRIDVSESDRLNEFREAFEKQVEREEFVPPPLQDLKSPLWNLQVPYIPRYNYREERVIGPSDVSPDPATQKLIDAYRRIAVHLAVLAREDDRLRGVFAGEIASAFPHLSPRTPQMAPSVSENWVERAQEMAALEQALRQRAGSQQVSRLAVWGPPGSGKTSLVASACRNQEIVRAYPDGILWLTADRHWTADAARDWLRTAFGLSPRAGERALQEILKDRRFLIVADDVWQVSDVEEVFKFGGCCTQVIITRDLGAASAFSDTLVSIGSLTPEEAERILKSSPPQAVADDPHVQEVLTWPLGATVLRSALERRLAQGKTVAAAWEELGEAFRRHGIGGLNEPGTADRGPSVTTSLKETISRLDAVEKALLLRVANASDDGLAMDDLPQAKAGAAPARDPQLRLQDLGLVRINERARRLHIEPIFHAYLLAQGELDEQLGTLTRTRGFSSSVDKQRSAAPDVDRAKQILRGERAALDDVESLAERLKDHGYFGYARRLFARARQHPDVARLPKRALKLVQRHALCTYKDPDLPRTRFADALTLLAQGDLAADEPSAETLGLAGAVHKYQWKLSGLRHDLEQSLAYYGRGAARGIEHDYGYTAINTAFVLDLLARQEEESPQVAARRAGEAQALREKIVAVLPALATQQAQMWLRSQWWFFATLAEACFGLGRHDEARYWLREGLVVDTPEWQLESTTRQLAALAVAQHQDFGDRAEASRTLSVLVGDSASALRGITIGKIGLALSGGGFRASLFHIGVLARMAELDMLRHLDVLSCVSGGSIVGAHYYLEVRRLLQEKTDGEISRQDYIDVVRRIERELLAATQKNLRTRLFAAWWANLRSIVQPGYTRTTCLGDLLERHVYSRVPDGNRGHRWLGDLDIEPKDTPNFNPKLDNWRRSAKAPILLLNATTVNTGHNWQFAVRWMGEPPLDATSQVDRNDIFRRMYYWEAPSRYRRVRLGQAVAASACVPALFDPIELKGLFPERSVNLVDGGVHDNQGIAGLLEQECTVILVSDASGQTNTEARPSGELPAVALRANDLLMARVREAQFRELDLLRRASALNGLVYLHLRKDLEARQLDWVDCQDPYELLEEARPAQSGGRTVTSYGIPFTVQARLAGIRTDLDSFSETEGYALMLSGYRMAEADFKQQLPAWSWPEAHREPWSFLAIEDVVTRTPGTEFEHAQLLRTLTVSAARSFKVWRLAPVLASSILAVLLLAVLAAWRWEPSRLAIELVLWSIPGVERVLLDVEYDPPAQTAGRALLAVAACAIVAWLLHRLFRTGKSATVIVTGLLMVTVGWLGAVLHLAVFDPLYQMKGKVRRRVSSGT
jgi:predicted acylesterase/phospholipase RssA